MKSTFFLIPFRFIFLPLLCGFLMITMCGCLVEVDLPSIQVTPSATPLPSSTPTIVWFPATSTHTPLPTVAIFPTEEMRPGLDEIIVEDDFSDTSQWMTVKSVLGKVVYGQNELSIAVAQPRETLISFRKSPTLENFYLEVSANPHLCRPEDYYGVIFRASSGEDCYRVLVNCGGMVALERYKKNHRPYPVQSWTYSGEVPIGSPASLRLGLWVVKKEMRVFVNDVFQFAASDPVWSSGSIGLFATSGGETAVSISFTELVIRSIGYIPPTPTPAPTLTVTKVIKPVISPTR